MTDLHPPASGTGELLATPLGAYELTLEVADLAASDRFYGDLLGLPVVARWEPPRPATWYDIGGTGFLGLWPVETGGAVAIANGRGGAHVHFALRVGRGSLRARAERLEAANIPVEWIHFDQGNVAIYATDPDGNVVELTEIVADWAGRPVSDPVDARPPKD